MAKKLSEDMADLLLNERVTITLSDETTHNFVQQVLEENRFLVMGNDYQERKAFTGTVAYIPYLDDMEVTEDGEILSGTIQINYVDAPNIYPVSWNNARVTECIFTFPHTVARKKYVQVQSHLLENGEYVIRNTVLRCESGSPEGTELSEEEWKQLKPFKMCIRDRAVSNRVDEVLGGEVSLTVYLDTAEDFNYIGELEIINDGSDGTRPVIFIHADHKTEESGWW